MEPTGAISVAGAKKYARVKNAQDEKYVAVLAAANMDFDRLRFVSERSDDRERFMAVKIPEKIGSFQELYDVIFPHNVTEFTYRMDSEADDEAHICMSIQTKTEDEFLGVVNAINKRNDMHAIDLASNELAKSHLRHLAGGRPDHTIGAPVERESVPLPQPRRGHRPRARRLPGAAQGQRRVRRVPGAGGLPLRGGDGQPGVPALPAVGNVS
ncbi:hypothetical protein ON010_g10228 [Phytophthora cinnamomi]|nr:hypothetical protein ON010_g10228 [Phytophthora cinnamomi]